MRDRPKTIIIDIETTGLVPKIMIDGKKQQLPYETGFMEYPFIVSMAWIVNDGETKNFVLNQEGREIPVEASNIHKITTEIANQSTALFCDVFRDFADDSEGCQIVVGHGLYFDTSIIKANVLRDIELGRLDKSVFEQISEILHKSKRIDTMRATAKIMRKWPTLSELYLKIFHSGFNAHNSKDDAEAIYRCYEWLKKKGIVPTLEELQEKVKEKEMATA